MHRFTYAAFGAFALLDVAATHLQRQQVSIFKRCD